MRKRETIHIPGIKYCLSLLLFALLMIGGSCSESPQDQQLQKAEDYIACGEIDSALVILDGPSMNGLSREKERALHALLLTTARYKNFEDETDDSLINIAVNYYEKHGPEDRLMQSYIRKAKILDNKGEGNESAVLLRKTEDLADELHDESAKGNIYRDLANIYGGHFDKVMALNYAKKSYDSFKNANDTAFLSVMLLDIAQYSTALNRFEDALKISDGVIREEIESNDSALLAFAWQVKGYAHFGMKDWRRAKDALSMSDRFNSNWL